MLMHNVEMEKTDGWHFHLNYNDTINTILKNRIKILDILDTLLSSVPSFIYFSRCCFRSVNCNILSITI